MGIIPLGAPMAPPTRFRIWRAGNNPGDFGDNVLTASAAAAVVAEYKRRGHALAIDIQHATNVRENPDYDPANPPPIAGYAEIRAIETTAGVELWADPVRWSDCQRPHAAPGAVCCGKHQIVTGQRAYISPDWNLDPGTREPLSINRLSLVAEPGTYGINMLAARAGASQRTTPMNDTEILKALLAAAMGAAASQDADVQAFGALVSQQAAELASAKGIVLDDAAPGSEPAPAAGEADPKKDEPAPAMAAAETDIEKAVAKAVAAALRGVIGAPATSKSVVASKDEVRAMITEDGERRALIAANKDALGAMAPLLASKPLAEVKAFVAAVASKSTGADTGAPRGGVISGSPEQSKTFSLADRFAKKSK